MNKKLEDIIGSLFGLAIIGGLAAWGLNDFHPETREEHAARLTCEMAAMKPEYGNSRPLSASDAEAYCAKEKEAMNLWKKEHGAQAQSN